VSNKVWYLGKTKETQPLYIYLKDFQWEKTCRPQYWGGGYIEGYRSRRRTERGWQMHTHFDGCFLSTVDQRGHSLGNFFTPWMTVPEYVDNPIIVRNGAAVWESLSFFLDDAQYSEAAWWRIKDLFKQFYIYKKAAGAFHSGGHCTSRDRKDAEINLDMKEMVDDHIGDVIIPELRDVLDYQSKSWYEEQRKYLVENAMRTNDEH
jgi:hypothetical protein